MHITMRFIAFLTMALLAVVVNGQLTTPDPMTMTTGDPIEVTTSGGPQTSAPTPFVTPTPAPMEVVTPAPVDTAAPVVPTPAPMEVVTPAPVSVPPTTAPPTTPPPVDTMAPTEATAMPTTAAPTTPAPVETPAPVTVPPTTAPPTTPPPVDTMAPTEATAMPTEMPATVSPAPVEAPTAAPVEETTVPTAEPTAAPTAEPTAAPTKATTPTMPPTTPGMPVEPAKFPNLSMTMLGVTTMDDDSWKTFEGVTKDFYIKFYAANPQFGVTNIETLLEYVSHETARSRRLEGRQLQDQLTVVYNQAISYSIIPDTGLEPADVVTQPFASQTSRDAFAQLLKASDDPAYANIQSVSPVTQAAPADSDDGGLSTAVIIGIAVGGAAGAALLAGGGYWLFTRNKSGGYAKDVGDQPPSSLNLGGGDDVSTLQDPTRGDNKMSTYGDQSVATVDYDYSKAYGGGGDTSVVSSVGGTLGSQTAAGPGAGVVDASFSDDASFDAHYQDPNASVKEIALEVWAPPGKLGVVIDTPNDGAPVVHAIKDSSPIADKLQVGDKLVAVDDENVETMTAIKVSKLISRKSANSTRKLSIVRTVAGGDGMP